jgi:hypothetical protein
VALYLRHKITMQYQGDYTGRQNASKRMLAASLCILAALTVCFVFEGPFDFSSSIDLDGYFIVMPRNCYLIKP